MDLALCIEKLVPQAEYGGSTTANTKEAYDNLRWEDKRKKPSWQEILAVSKEVDDELEELKGLQEAELKVQKEMRNLAIERLVEKHEITEAQAIKLKKIT